MIRKFNENRKIYPNEQSALKQIYLAIHQASKNLNMPIYQLKPARNHFANMYEERMPVGTSKFCVLMA